MYRRTMGTSSSPSSTSLQAEAERLDAVRSDIGLHLNGAEKQLVKTESDKVRLKSLWKILYDAEDALDDYDDWKKTGIAPPCTGRCRKRKRPGSTAEQSICRDPCSLCVEANIRKVLEDFRSLAKITSSLEIHRGHLWRTKDEAEVQTGCLSFERNIYGFKDDKDSLLKILTDSSECMKYIRQDCKGLKNTKLIIFPVVGPGGIGKTTLLQHLYCDKRITAHFEMKAWISCLPSKANLCALDLLNSLLDSVECSQLARAQKLIVSKLEKKRLFLVLDDARSTDKTLWEMFWRPISNAVAEGSIAMVTSRNTNVIEEMPIHLQKTFNYNLNPLQFHDCWSIFKSSMGSPKELEDGNDNELANIGEEIVDMYEGFPKAIKAIASNLRGSRDPEKWRQHLDMATRDYYSFWMTSYCELQPGSKRCLQYCTLFPRGYTFERDYLMKLWRAEGLETRDWQTSYYLTELIRQFFLMEDKNEGGHLVYKVATAAHRFLHNAKVSVTAISCQTDGNNIQELSFSEERHISFTGHGKEVYLQPESTEALQHLRSLLVIHSLHNRAYMKVSHLNFQIFQHMGHLRTLELSYTDIETVPDSISYLRNLRFLGLNGTRIETLPDTVCKLYKLQALELEYCRKLRELPKSIGNLVNLRCLDLDSDSKLLCMPKGLGKLINLESLPIFKVGEENGEQSGLEELGKLKNLKNELCILGLSHASVKDLKIRCLEEKEHLKTLKLCWSSSHLVGSSSKHSWSHDTSVLKPHTNLKNLIIQSYNGNELPNWITCTSFKKLEFIYLKECLNCESLPPLGQLPSLKRLVINCPKVKIIDAQFCGDGSGSFPSLMELTFIGMWNLQEWTAENVNNFPKLEMLNFDNCPRLKEIPEYSFKRLESMYLRNSLNCESLPPLGQLSSLKHLVINCPKVKKIDAQFYGNISGSFPSLEELTFRGMWNLQAWAVDVNNLPTLKKLEFDNCPIFERIQKVTSTSLVSVSFICCKGPISLGDQPNLKHLWIEECDKLNLDDTLIQKLKELDSLFLANCHHNIPEDFEVGDASFYKDEDHTISFDKTPEGEI